MTAEERDRALDRYREIEAKRVAGTMTIGEAHEQAGIAEALDHADEQAAIHRG